MGQLVGQLNTTIGTVKSESLGSSWGDKQTDTMGYSGGWESEPYLNPTVGRRFLPDNLGYAMVESLTGDLFSVVFKTTKASLGTIVIPNLDIPPDRNIMLFPIDDTYTKASTLDGKIGLMNDPKYQDADIERGSYYKPVEAYAMQNQIEYKQQKALAFAAQYDAINKGRTGNQDMDQVKQNLASSLEEDPSSNSMYKMIPAQGIVNKFVWTADGGIYSDQRNFGAKATKTYTGFRKIGGGGGVSANGEFFAVLGFAWSFDIMATHSVQIDVGKTEEVNQSVTLELNVEGEAFLQAWNPQSNNNEGAYSGQNAPGKVKAYRFSSFYLPPNDKNSTKFNKVIDPYWLKWSTDPIARAMREINLSNPTWRVFHRTTYIERVPPLAASAPSFAPISTLKIPDNLAGNIVLCSMVSKELSVLGNVINRLTAGAAVAVVMNPIASSPGVYPTSKLGDMVPWWETFLDSARPDSVGSVKDPANAVILNTLFNQVVDYMYNGFATKSIQELLSNSK